MPFFKARKVQTFEEIKSEVKEELQREEDKRNTGIVKEVLRACEKARNSGEPVFIGIFYGEPMYVVREEDLMNGRDRG